MLFVAPKDGQPPTFSPDAVWGAAYAWLLAVWILLFLLGTAATIAGTIPLQRGIPAGAFLLFFIIIFGRFVWSSRRAKA